MPKTLTTIILTVLTVLFAMQNFDHVPVYLFWGKAVSIRLVFVIAIAISFGYLIRHFTGIRREERLKRQLYKLMRNKNKRVVKKRSRPQQDIIDDEI